MELQDLVVEVAKTCDADIGQLNRVLQNLDGIVEKTIDKKILAAEEGKRTASPEFQVDFYVNNNWCCKKLDTSNYSTYSTSLP